MKAAQKKYDVWKIRFPDPEIVSIELYTFQIDNLIENLKCISDRIEHQLNENQVQLEYLKKECDSYIEDLQMILSKRIHKE